MVKPARLRTHPTKNGVATIVSEHITVLPSGLRNLRLMALVENMDALPPCHGLVGANPRGEDEASVLRLSPDDREGRYRLSVHLHQDGRRAIGREQRRHISQGHWLHRSF